MVKKLEPVVSLGLPHSLGTPLPLVSSLSDPRYSTLRGTATGKRQYVPDAAGGQKSIGDYIDSYLEWLGGLLKYYSREAT